MQVFSFVSVSTKHLNYSAYATKEINLAVIRFLQLSIKLACQTKSWKGHLMTWRVLTHTLFEISYPASLLG